MSAALVILVCLFLAFMFGMIAAGPLARRSPDGTPRRSLWFTTTVIPPGAIGVRIRDGKIIGEAPPGRYRMFDPFGRTSFAIIPANPIAGARVAVDLVSKDQFSLRATLVPIVRIANPRAHVEGQSPQPSSFVNGGATDVRFDNLADRLSAAAVTQSGSLTLDELVGAPAMLGTRLAEALADCLPGATIDEVLVSALTVPPEVRKMFTEVERARREGLASLERARGEQASLRALANAARTLESNPQLAQLRLLQTMEGAKGAKTFVLGQSTMGLPVQVGPVTE